MQDHYRDRMLCYPWAEPIACDKQMLRDLDKANEWDPFAVLFVFSDHAEKTAEVRESVELSNGLALHGKPEHVRQSLLRDQRMALGITLDLGLIHDLTPSVIHDLLGACLDLQRQKHETCCRLVVISTHRHREVLRRTRAWEVRTAEFDFDQPPAPSPPTSLRVAASKNRASP